MSRKVKWGVISTAEIFREKVLPGMRRECAVAEVVAISSRDEAKAKKVARELGIPKAYGSYEGMLADDEIEAVYNPLPNSMHADWSIACMEAGKHVLCEKPAALTTGDVKRMIEARDRSGVKIGEAFMVRTHPQWIRARDLVRGGSLGKLQSIFGYFSYFLLDPDNIRNRAEVGGGSMWDIGCYPITTSRFVLDEEPTRVVSMIEYDPTLKTDRLTSFMMDFPSCHAIFTVGTQTARYQTMMFLGTEKRLEIEVPFNAPVLRPCRVYIDPGVLFRDEVEVIEIPTCDQYAVEMDRFSASILDDDQVPVPLENSLHNVAVIEAVFRSAKTGDWEKPIIP
jgi:predicted dehydrogenase